MQATNLLKRPRLRTVENLTEERHASWLELFFDLVFVVAVAQVAHNLSEDLTAQGLLRYGALFALVWWAWVGYSFYSDRFESNDTTYRVLMFAGMLAVTALAVNVHDALGSGARAFALSYTAVRVVLVVLYLRARKRVPVARDLCTRYSIGFGVGVALWLLSVFVPAPYRFMLWAAGFAVELLTPLFSASVIRRTPYDATHIPERFGLFTIIVLGEAVLAVATGITDAKWQLASSLVAAAGFAIAACLWWIYFDFVEGYALLRRGWLAAGQVYVYGHLPVVLGVTAAGVGVKQAILESGNTALTGGARWTLCGGLALFLLSISAIRIAARRTHLIRARMVTAGVILFSAFVGAYVAPLLLICVVLGALAAEVGLEVFGEARAAGAEAKQDEPETQCAHLDQIRRVAPDNAGCGECLALGDTWVELRMCRSCGHVGCCDNSKYKHATMHFQATDHPIIKSFEANEDWSWCYVDQIYLPTAEGSLTAQTG
ncbi:MAG: low temperature requirement protein A [Pyrinomonadaceae bacterium]